MTDIDFAVKYPFSQQAKEAIADRQATDELMERALALILSSMTGQLQTRVYAEDEEKKEDIAAYAMARMILGAMRNRYITGKFAVAVSKRTRRYINSESESGLKQLLTEFNIRIRRGKDSDEVYLIDYLRFTPHDQHYTLLNREFSAGWVRINDAERNRMIEEAVRKHVDNIPLLKDPSDKIKQVIERLEQQLPKQEERKINVKPGDYPPCILWLLDEVKKHHNLPHQARWFLAVYMIHIGMSDEDIISIFSNLPDFQEKITRYQVTHARKQEYSIPTCATVVSYGLCRADCGIKSPAAWRGKR
ncbi:MAG: hypothetical protein V1492_06475 [Candidatus Micrarchaeota archaeon]